MNIIPWRRNENTPAEFDDFWGRLWNGDERFANLPKVFRRTGYPATNVSETEEAFCVSVDAPGLDEKDFQVELMGNQLLLSGERKWEEEKKDKEFHSVESQYGKFERAVMLPDGLTLEKDAIRATYKKGVLRVEVPKKERTPAARIPVTAG